MGVARRDPPDGAAISRRRPSTPSGRAPVRRRPPAWRALLAPLAGLMFAASAVVPGPAIAAGTWSRNLYLSSALVYQDPYYTACTAASTMTMLNIIAMRGTGGPAFTWTPYRVRNSVDPANKRDMVSILAFARANDTLRSTSPGSDAHGWRNALNAYGWGGDVMTDPARMVYVDRAYPRLRAALRAAVRAIARQGMPVGILGWAGGHAQVMTGYVVTGANPSVSDDFTVRYVYLTDPLKSDRMANRRLSVDQLKSGALKYRFQRYREADSPYDDPYTIGSVRSSVTPTRGVSEWYHRWVIVVPVRPGPDAPVLDPSQTPDGSPAATPTPAPSADPSAGSDPTPAMSPAPTQDPSSSASPVVEAAASSPSPVADPTPTPTAAATPSPAPTPAPTTPPPDPTPAATASPTASSPPDPTPAETPTPTPG